VEACSLFQHGRAVLDELADDLRFGNGRGYAASKNQPRSAASPAIAAAQFTYLNLSQGCCVSAPEPWYMPRPGARLVGRIALAGGLACALGYTGIVYLSLQPVRQFNHLTLIGRVALLFVLGLCASL